MSILFAPCNIADMHLSNRFVRSATYDACGDDQAGVTDRQIELFRDLAAGGIGLIITGVASVLYSGRIRPLQIAAEDDSHVAGLHRLVKAVHEEGSRIALQLHHGGRVSAPFLNARNRQAVAPSYVPDDPHFGGDYRAMDEEEILEVVAAFGRGAAIAGEAGFDAVQIHGAHGFLFSQFLSPFANRREDAWGGSLENRLRIHREVYDSVRRNVGPGYPVLLKLGVQDGFSGGLQFSEGKRAARLLAEKGYDALEISLGLRGKEYEETEFRTEVETLEDEAYYRHWCEEITRQVDGPVMVVGGLRSFGLMEDLIDQGTADFVSMCRPFIREPALVNRWRAGDRAKATCISCNLCLEGVRQGKALQCWVD
jgi:2,4-dienoyl-CoA reductase-like NADH-dependent reductase (Old Yellow Enzyme family)